MANAQEIRTKINSIKSTQKITKAMEMVAASKMRKAQDRMYLSRPYVERVETVIKHITSSSMIDYVHPYIEPRPVKKVGYIVVSSDRGLCGGLNVNLFKQVLKEVENLNEKNIKSEIAVIGTKAYYFFLRNNAKIVAKINHLGDEPILRDLIGIITVMLDLYDTEKIDELYVAYNGFVNTMCQSIEIKKLLPLVPGSFRDVYINESIAQSVKSKKNNEHGEINKIIDAESADKDKKHINWDYIYEPNPKILLDSLFNRYIESLIYQAAVENVACEQSSRMVAMQSATENADELIKEFNLLYNKVRQASITSELSEIIAGAAAV